MSEFYYSVVEYAVLNEKTQQERPDWRFVRVELHAEFGTEEYHMWLPPNFDIQRLESLLNSRRKGK